MTETEMGVLIEILLGAGIPLRIGLMIATALFLGYFIYDHTTSKNVPIKILIVGAIFLLFEVWITVSIFNNIGHKLFVPPIITIVIMGGFFLGGMAGGMYMAQGIDKISREALEKEDKVIEDIKSNGKR